MINTEDLGSVVFDGMYAQYFRHNSLELIAAYTDVVIID